MSASLNSGETDLRAKTPPVSPVIDHPQSSLILGGTKSVISWFQGVPKAYWRLSSIEFLFWFATATGTYLTVFLQKKGFMPTQVGFINAVNSLVMIFATPFWGMMADKIRSIRKVFLFCICIAAVLWAVIPFSSQIAVGPLVLMYLIVPLGSFFRMPANSLLDAFVVQRSDLDKVAYGHVRLWGSISFAIMNISLSAILPLTGVEVSFYLYGVAFLPLLIIMWQMKSADGAVLGVGRRKALSFKQMGFGRLFKNYYFITYLVFAVFIHMPANTSMAFLPYLVASVGGDTAQLGLISGYKALLEIPMLLLMRPLRRKFPLPVAIAGAGVFYSIEALLYSRANSLIGILFIQTLHGLGGGLMIGAATNYVYSLAPPGLNSTAHTMNGAANAIAAIVGSLSGGFLIVAIGIRSFYLLAGAVIAFALFYFLLSLFIGTKILKKPIPLSNK
ncbi:MAG: MFS transporter [Treponema sp.]|nr:MFS transporter [Treponema sp.]